MTRMFTIASCLALAVVSVTSSAVPLPIHVVDHHPRYAFNYAVSDPHTHDKKAQWELRNGGTVKGSYSLVEPDGSLRIVDYFADDHHGFNAVVKKLGPNVHAPGKLVHGPIAPIAHIAPVAQLPALTPPTHSYSYGFGPAPLGHVGPTSLGHWSLPWDPVTHSFGGWVPFGSTTFHGHLRPSPYATIITKKFDKHGRLIATKVSAPMPIKKIRVVKH